MLSLVRITVLRARICSHLTGDPGYFDAIPDGDRPLGQNHQAADEIAGDILQTEAHAHTDCASENRQSGEMNPGVFQDNENADHQHDVADDLGNRVLERTIEAALRKQPVKKKAFRSRRNPKNRDQERDQQKNLKQTQLDGRKSRVPGQWNSSGVNRTDRKKDDRRQTQDGRDDRDKICVDLETAKKTANDMAL